MGTGRQLYADSTKERGTCKVGLHPQLTQNQFHKNINDADTQRLLTCETLGNLSRMHLYTSKGIPLLGLRQSIKTTKSALESGCAMANLGTNVPPSQIPV